MTTLVRYMPSALGVITFIVLCAFTTQIADFLLSFTVEWTNLYAAVFDWAAIQTGFLFGVYGFVMGSPTAFMKAIQKTKNFKYFKFGMIVSLIVGFVLTIASFPLLVFAPNPFSSALLVKLFTFGWFSIFVFALCTFFRSAYLFAFMTRQKPASGVDG